MKKITFDIDIDLPTSFNPEDVFEKFVYASMINNDEIKKHNSGIYFQNIPQHPYKEKLSSIPYKEAEEIGYVKIDFLHLSILDDYSSKDEIKQILTKEPDWSMLEKEEIVEKLFHIHNHFKTINKIKPRSIEELADCLALIRPSKKNLIDLYLKDKKLARKFLYTKPKDDKYYFKKSHAIAYAHNIILQMHKIKEGLIQNGNSN